MRGSTTARQWERFGRDDPYFGVYSTDEFHGREHSDEVRAQFFAWGDQAVDRMLAEVRRLVAPGFEPRRVLEYGCGVGRVLIPLARRAEHATGLDVSPSMLAEARRNCDAAGVSQTDLVPSTALDELPAHFDLVVSTAVFQHIRRRQGERILARLVERLAPGGVGAVNVTIGATRRLRAFNRIMKLPLAHNLLNVARGRSWDYPWMEMNVYDLSRVGRILRDRGIEVVHVELAAREGGFDACTLYFRR